MTLRLRRALLLAAVLSALMVVAEAQEKTPVVDVFGGFSLLNAKEVLVDGEFTATRFHGWEASVTGNLNRWLGITGDFSGHYNDTEPSASYHYFLGGPTFSYRTHRLTPYAHALFGMSRLSARVTFSATGVNISDSSFAAVLGGGIDLNLGRQWAIRVVQADYLRTNFNSAPQHNLRVSSGLVFRFGAR